MRRFLPLLVLASCADVNVELAVTIPDALKPLVRAIDLHVYVPPAGAPFVCEDLELGRVAPETLRFAEAQVVSSPGLGVVPIGSIDRFAEHVLLVEVLGEEERPLAHACAGVPELSEDLSIELTAVPAARIVVPEGLELSRFTDDEIMPSFQVTVLDALDRPIPGALVQWTVAGAEGAAAPASVSTGADGTVTVTPALPDRPGPIVVELRTRWGTGEPPILRGLVVGAPSSASVPGYPLAALAGRFLPGRDGVASLFARGAMGRTLEIYDAGSFAGGAALRPAESHTVGEASALGRLDYPGNEEDRIVALETPGNTLVFTRIDPDGRQVARTTPRPAGAGAVRRALSTGACRAPGRPKLTIVFEGDVVAEYDEQGNLLSAETRVAGDADFHNSGCMSDVNGTPHRVLVRSSLLGWTVLELDGTVPLQTAEWLGPPGLVTFAPSFSEPEVMIAPLIDGESITVARGRLTGDGGVEVVSSDVVDGVPFASSGVDADGDGRLDVTSLLTMDTTSRGERDFSLFVSLAEQFKGRHIAGSIRLPEPLCYAILLGGDFDGDGMGDAVVVETTRLLCGSLETSRAYLFRLGLNAR